jgi:hypothetical protein
VISLQKSGFFVVLVYARESKKLSAKWHARDLDKNSFESKAKNFAFIKVSQVAGFLI